MHVTHHYVGGEWVEPLSTDAIDVVNPATEATIAAVPMGGVRDVDRAVEAAHRAFEDWSVTSPSERAAFLGKIAQGLEDRASEIAASIVDEVGTPLRTANRIQAALPVTVLRSYVDLLDDEQPDERIGNSLVVREPVGVVAAITPWNYPLHQVVAKLAPALAAGCTMVIKPSEVAPLTALILAEVVHDAGLPAGVVNVIPGTGAEVGEALASHPLVHAVSFTGSVRAGTSVAALAAKTVKRVTLELGGKSANVVLDDADLTTAVKVGVANAFLNNGQTCTAWTRMIVPRDRMREACELAVAIAETFEPGHPRNPSTKLGPMASRTHHDSVRRFIEQGVREGAHLLTGGSDRPEGLDRGYYVRPTVFGDVHPDHTIAQEEIFGPVLSILGHDGDEDAVRLANDSRYGLHGCVWAADTQRAVTVARAIRTGSVDINGAQYNPLAPFGGYKQSGVGREMGPHGLAEYQELKAIQL